MKYLLLTVFFVGVFLLVLNRPTTSQLSDELATENELAQDKHTHKLAEVCHSSWQQLDWTIGEQEILARNNQAFSDGIRRICQARAELFFEGYELSPFIAPDEQTDIFPIVFISDVDELKTIIRQNLPELRII